MKKTLLCAIFILTLIQLACAQDYYADLDINIDKYDLVTITGQTDYPDILTEHSEQHISKIKGVRTFKLETADQFSEYIAKINLPNGASISRIESPGTYRIENKLGKLSIITFGENQPLSITVEYTVSKASNLYGLYIILILSVATAAYFLIKRSPRKKTKPDFKGLTYRQKQIMQLLIEKNKPLTQTDLEQELKLPKSSISRNIQTLELKGKIEKEKVGMSNKIRLKQD